MRPAQINFFFFNDTATTEIYTLSLHDALPISGGWALNCSTYTVTGAARRCGLSASKRRRAPLASSRRCSPRFSRALLLVTSGGELEMVAFDPEMWAMRGLLFMLFSRASAVFCRALAAFPSCRGAAP